MNDFRFAARMLLKHRLSTGVILVLVGLGIGVGTTIFAIFDAVLIRSLPVREPERLVLMVQRISPTFPPRSNFPYAYYEALRDHASTLQFAFGEAGEGVHLRLTIPMPAEQVTVGPVTPEFFEALGVKAYLGRVLMADDATRQSGMPPVVLSYGFWQRRFGGDRSVIDGRTITVNGHRLLIVGVMKRGFNGLSADTSPDIRMPLYMYAILTGSKVDSAFLRIAGRMKPGVSQLAAEAQCLAIWQARMKEVYGSDERTTQITASALLKRGMQLEPLARGTSLLRENLNAVLTLMMAAISVLLLIIGLNVAGLLLIPTCNS